MTEKITIGEISNAMEEFNGHRTIQKIMARGPAPFQAMNEAQETTRQ